MQGKIDVDDPTLPRAPARYGVGSGEGHHPQTLKELYCQHYYEYLDLIVIFIRARVDLINQDTRH